MKQMAWRLLVLWMIVTGGARLGAEPVIEEPLGPSGEPLQWLILGDIPIPDASNKEKWSDILERDLLAPAGGELAIKPVGGQEVKLPEGSFTWKVCAARAPVMENARRPGWRDYYRLPLFVDSKGSTIENATAYLYGRLVVPTAVNASFLIGTDDGTKIILNGQVIHRFARQRSALNDTEEVVLPLRAGSNELLIRIDNYVGTGGFVGRLLAANGTIIEGLKVQLPATAQSPKLELPPREAPKKWAELIAEIPPLAPLPHEELLGSRLTRTMALLQDSARTRRPVRIVFLGQSITDQEWTVLLVDALRERYPGAIVEMENHSLGGWFVWRLMRAMYHGTLQSRPDLVVFHAYQGSYDDWERVLSAVKRETSAEIMIRTAHWSGGDWESIEKNPKYPGSNSEETMLRQLAQKYDCELVECRREWCEYGLQHDMADYRSRLKQGIKSLVSDGIHLSRKGNVLMAQLYERHFRMNFNGRSWWADRVRWYEATRPLSDHIDTEIRLEGKGWKPQRVGDFRAYVESSSSDDVLKLKFTGTRADVVLAPGKGSARVRIDGKAPAAHNLYYGTLPKLKISAMSRGGLPGFMRYFTGPAMLEEVWEMQFTRMSDDGKFKYRLVGSQTGFDGEGKSGSDFVSKSGRIRIYKEDFESKDWGATKDDEVPALEKPIIMTWQIMPRFLGALRWKDSGATPPNVTAYSYITVVDGLPYGEHELEIIPVGDGPVAIRGIEVHRPPLAGE